MDHESHRPPPLFAIGARITILAGQWAGRTGQVIWLLPHANDPRRDMITVQLDGSANRRESASMYPTDLGAG